MLLRSVWRGRVWAAQPFNVVEDSDEALTLYIPPGSSRKRPVWADGSHARLPLEGWLLRDEVWHGSGVLRPTIPGAAHGVLGFLNEDHTEILAWYVNLEEPLRRTPLGFDTMDLLLDMWVQPDLSSWRWKDEDELAEAVRLGVLTVPEAEAIRAEGERALKLIHDGTHLINREWQRWQPDRSQPVPQLPPGWDAV